jgi:UrcA family protein
MNTTMHHTRFRISIGAACLIAWGAAVTAFPAVAADAPPTAKVKYGDLDLNNPAGVNQLYVRIRTAAEHVCGPPNHSLELAVQQRRAGCVDQAVAGAVANAHQPALAALHSAKTGAPKALRLAAE